MNVTFHVSIDGNDYLAIAKGFVKEENAYSKETFDPQIKVLEEG